jgi:RND family efflux transporter MFP subunit
MSNTVDRPVDWAAVSFETALERLESSSAGLSDAEATRRLAQYGPNRLPSGRRRSALVRFALQFHNVLIYVLIAAAIVTALLGHWVDTAVIVAVVVINAIIGFIQEGKAEQAMEAVRGMLSFHATVIREGHRRVVDAETLVPGDVVFVQSGDKAPADLRLIRVKSLQIQEAALTGESVPVDKDIAPVAPDALLGDRSSMAYSGTVVTYGQGSGVVVATGAATEIGRISAMLSEVEELTTPLLQRMAEFARWLTVIILVVAFAVYLIGTLAWGFSASEMFMAAVSLAVAAIPEGLPAIITITLAIGVERMARRNAIIRRLPAVETLGAVTTICSDKTGTLTRNELTVRTVATAGATYEASGSGYDPHGGFARLGQRDGQDVSCEDAADLLATLRAASLCNDAVLREEREVWSVEGDPTEGALLTAAVKAGVELRAQALELPRTDEIPFESQHRFMATLHHDHRGEGSIFVKGAPERLLEMCFWQCDAESGQQQLDAAFWTARIHKIAAKGQRVLGVAQKRAEEGRQQLAFDDVDKGLVFLGLIGLIDPPRRETLEAVRLCAQAGVGVKMITGDHAATAVAIGRELGLERAEAALTGHDLDALSDDQLCEAAARTTIFARTSPEHKLRLVKALQSQGQIVAMTGDGVNDAPALKRADIGIAMGVKGTEAAKEAAEMVLADDNFASIVDAVSEGRVVYENLRKTILYLLPTNGGQALTVIFAIAIGDMLPVTPVQILWVNLVTAVTLGIALAFEPPSRGIMTRPPRAASEPILSRYYVWRIVLVSILMLIATLGLYEYAEAAGMGLERARTVAVNTLVACEATYLFNARFLSEPSISWRGLFGSPAVLIAVGLTIALQALFTYAPFMQEWFATEALDLSTWGRILAASAALFLVVEIEKAVFRSMTLRRWSRAVFAPSAGRGWRRTMAIGLLAFLAAGGGLAYRALRHAPRVTAPVVTESGVVEPISVVPAPARVAGVVEMIQCDRGTKVAAGQICAKLDARPLQTAVEAKRTAVAESEKELRQREARLAAARDDLDRKTTGRRVSRKALATSRASLERAEEAARRAQAALAERRSALAAAEKALSEAEIVAPVDGVVVARNIEVGRTVAPGVAPLFVIGANLSDLRIAVRSDDKNVGSIREGDAATVTAEAVPDRRFSGVVRSVRRAPAAGGLETNEIVVDVANANFVLEPGMTATVEITVDPLRSSE